MVAAIDVMRLIRAGRLDTAEGAADECFQLGVEVGDADATGYYGAHLLTIRLLQGREAELAEVAKDIATSHTLVTPEFSFHAVAAALAARAERREEATAMLRDLTHDGLEALPRSSTWFIGITAIVHAARTLADADLADAAYALLAPFAARPIMPSLAVSCLGSAEWALGLASLTAGRPTTAVEHLERAVDANRRLGHRPMTMIAHADLADALVARGDHGEGHRAVRSWRDAAAIASEIDWPTAPRHGEIKPPRTNSRSITLTPANCGGSESVGSYAPGAAAPSSPTSSACATSGRSSNGPG